MTSRSSASRKISLAVGLAVLLVASAAAAKKRVVVTRFDGRGDDAQRAATAVVAREATVVSDAAWRRSLRKLKLKAATSPDAVARVAGDVQADGVVKGSVQRTGKQWGLTLTVLDGRTGQVSDTLSIPLRSYRMDTDAKRAIAAQLAPAIAKLGNEPPVEINPEPQAQPARVPDVDTEKPPTLAEAPPAVETRAPEAPVATVATSADDRYGRSRAADLEVGLGFQVRNLSFTFPDSLPAAQRPNGYNGSLVPSVLVDAEVYPLAFGGQGGAVSGLGAGLVLERVLAIKSKLVDTEYDTSQMRLGGGLRYRFGLGDKPTSPTLKILLGIEHLDFSIDRGMANLGFPNVAYTYLTLGAAARVPLGSPKLALRLDVRYLHVLDAGEISSKDFYGSGSTLGVDGDLALEYIFAGRGVVRVGGHYQRFAFDFDGNGALSNNRDGNPATQDVGGATDAYFGAYATVGYLF